MEPLSIIALTGNILQFVEKVGFLISASREISASGTTSEHDELSLIAQELKTLVSELVLSDGESGDQLDEEEKALRALGVQCNEVAHELLEVLESLKVKSKDKRTRQVETFYKLLLSEWKKPKVDNLQERLERIGSSIQRHISAYDSRKILSRLDKLLSKNQRLEAHRDDEISALRAEMVSVFKDLRRDLQNQESRNNVMAALLDAAARGSQYAIEQYILEQIRYEELTYRYEAIRDAHSDTFSWLFSSNEQRSAVNFEEWLQSDDDLYWISGKPGSGKSTLMKSLHNNPATVEKLRSYANGKRVIIASFFFWDAGKSIQKSQEGLLRALIFEILRQNPDFISKLFPSMWLLLTSTHGDIPREAHNSSVMIPTSIPGLMDILQSACALAVESNAIFCFFIDGLDEYHGQPGDVIEFITVLRKIQNVKICVSSRPWNEFQREFGKVDARKLSMQEHNKNDIEKYVHNKLEEDENYQDLEDKHENGELLVSEIVEAANGVFLWVFLVVRSFQKGLENGDSLWDLRERLKQLPNDLNKYFDRIVLSDVEEFYRGHAAEMFMVTLEAEEIIPLMAYWYLREDIKHVINMKSILVSESKYAKRLDDTGKRLNAACKGLLEVWLESDRYCSVEKSLDPAWCFYHTRVRFLHRTVREYLVLDTTKAMLRKWYAADFEPHATICKMLVALAKISPPGPHFVDMISFYRRWFREHQDLSPPAPNTVQYIADLHADLYSIQYFQRPPLFDKQTSFMAAVWTRGKLFLSRVAHGRFSTSRMQKS